MSAATSEIFAQRLHEMVGGSAQAEPDGELRSIENPNVPITASQLADILSYGPTRSGVQVNEHTALTYTAVFAAIKILSESIAMLPLVVYRGDEDDPHRVRYREHSAYNLLRYEPNPEQTAVTFKETVSAHLVAWGNGYARIFHDRAGRPREVRPLLPDRTHPERFAGELRYTVEGPGGGKFAPEEILHIPGLGFTGIKGYSPIAYAREAIAMGKATEIFGATLFGNGAHMGGFLKHPNTLKPEARTNLRESINAVHAGVANAHRFMILEEGMEFIANHIPPDEAQFLESRKFQVIEVARIYRIPPHMLADLDRATFSNIEHLSLEFLTYTLAPWLEKWEAECKRKLLGSDAFCKFDERRLLRTDMAARQTYYAAGRTGGWLSINDIRAEEGMNPITKGGDTYLRPLNMAPVDLDADSSSRAAEGKIDPLNGAEVAQAVDVLMKVRQKSLSPEAAIALLARMGLGDKRAGEIVKSVPIGLENGGDVEFKREMLKSLMSVPAAREEVYNGTDVKDLIVDTGLKADGEREPDYIPVPVEPSVTPVSGNGHQPDDGGEDVKQGQTDPAKPGDEPADDTRTRGVEIIRRMVAEHLDRSFRKEANARSRAGFESRSVAFYGQHTRELSELLLGEASNLAWLLGRSIDMPRAIKACDAVASRQHDEPGDAATESKELIETLMGVLS